MNKLAPWNGVEAVIIGARAGFCYGVREAVDAAHVAAGAGKRVHTLGQIVHNPGISAALDANGIGRIESLEEASPGETVVIRAHGVTPAVRGEILNRGLDVIDGTCAWVASSQRAIVELAAEGYTIVLLATPGHPETIGLLGYAPDAIVVDAESDWERIPRRKRMALLAQSTQPPWKLERLAAYLTTRSHELKVVNTVCPVTIRRQADTADLAARVDLVVVVGGANSANTAEITRLVAASGVAAIQVASVAEIVDRRVFAGARSVGVTGGTSTPLEDLTAVAERVAVLAGTPAVQTRAHELAASAAAAVTEKAYRTTSLRD